MATEQQPDAPALPGVVRWRKRPVVVSAIQWTGANLAEVQAFTGGGDFDAVPHEDRSEDPDMTAEVFDKLHSTWVHVYDGQWIIRGVQGELYPIAADVLAATYEPAGEPLVLPQDEFEALQGVAETLGMVAAKPCRCGPDEPCGTHLGTSPSVAAAFDRKAARELVRAAIGKGWNNDDHPAAERVTEAVWPLLEHAQAALAGDNEGVRLWMLDCGELVAKHRGRAEAAEAKLATLAVHNRGHLELAGSCCPHLAQENLAIIGSEEETADGH